MKIRTTFLASLALLTFLACSNEPISEDDVLTRNDTTNENIEDSINEGSNVDSSSSENDDAPCVTTALVAGQHHVAGTVSISIVDGNLVVTYFTTEEWTLGTTHLSIGNCNDDWVPLNGAGNPQIGQFEFTEPTSTSDNEVVYIIALPDGFEGQDYCFSAHAEVEGPTGGETAWAEGEQFSGNSWAMYDEFNTSDCTDGGSNGGVF
ncbi:hypothetical protein [Winogradskyella aquimaris]|uniref:Uncharacterized protein n=1 Tax=Winogradskyella aquimaris TaxID=864074 RepID=A0ABU5EN83_9FLAO|nr:hypothetical protein [Winogradskyella aquimaris]MDY2587693.1 hypothetical protein [Winogradskyella aquimaris]